MNQTLFDNIRNQLKKGNPEEAFELLNDFFDNTNGNGELLLNQLKNNIGILQSSYHKSKLLFEKGLISYEIYSTDFNRITDALFAFCDSLSYEINNLKSTPQSTLASNRDKMIIELQVEEDFDSFSNDDIEDVITKPLWTGSP